MGPDFAVDYARDMPSVDSIHNRDMEVGFTLGLKLPYLTDVVFRQYGKPILGSLSIKKLASRLGTTAILFVPLVGPVLVLAIKAPAVTLSACLKLFRASNTGIEAIAFRTLHSSSSE